MKKILLLTILLTLTLSTSCGARKTTPTADPLTTDIGVTINGITWATRNVDAPGTFTANPEDAGMLFQWNRRNGWNAVDRNVESWEFSPPGGTAWYAENDPCPEGWRVPTEDELRSLRNAGSEWTTVNGINGRLFGTAPYQLFLPASGWRSGIDSSLNSVGVVGDYWSSTQNVNEYAVVLWLYSERVNVGGGWRRSGLSVRCVAKNN